MNHYKQRNLKICIGSLTGLSILIFFFVGLFSFQDSGNKDTINKAMAHFETEVYRYFKKYVADNDLRHTLGPYPLFSYLIKKEMELRNMFIISRGIEAGFSIEKIKRMIV